MSRELRRRSTSLHPVGVPPSQSILVKRVVPTSVAWDVVLRETPEARERTMHSTYSVQASRIVAGGVV